MHVGTLPVGTDVHVTALPHIRATVHRQGEMATLVKCEGVKVQVGEREFTRREIGMWSTQTEVTPCGKDCKLCKAQEKQAGSSEVCEPVAGSDRPTASPKPRKGRKA